MEYPGLGERLYSARLDNGLPVLVDCRPGWASCFAFFAVRYGGMDLRYQLDGEWTETPAGVAHFLEHKMFDTPEGNALQTLSANGASPNAFTSAEITGYYFECTRSFEDNLRTLLSFVSVPWFTPESVAKEQGIIGQEIDMVEDNPHWRLFNGLLGGLYAHHPIRTSVAGSRASIAGITAQTLYDCHRAFYHPGNMTLCVAGDVDPERVCRIAGEILPAEQRQAPARDYGPPEEMKAAREEVRRAMQVSTPLFLAGFKAEPAASGGEALRQKLVGELAADLLAGEASPLYARLYGKGLINQSFGAGFERYPGACFLALGGESRAPEAVAQAILEEGARIAREGLEDDRFRRARKAAYGSRVRGLNSLDNLCIQLARGALDGYSYFDFGKIYDTIEKRDVETMIGRLTEGRRMSLSVVEPVSQTIKE